jgi:hypothetical protein
MPTFDCILNDAQPVGAHTWDGTQIHRAGRFDSVFPPLRVFSSDDITMLLASPHQICASV